MNTPKESKTELRLAYNVDETAKLLGVSKVTVYRLLTRGKLKAIPGLRHKVIPRNSVLELLESGN